MAAQQVTRWDNVANGPPMTFTSGGTGPPCDGRPSHGSRFDVVTPGPPAARSPNEASGSSQAVQAASMRLQSLLNSETQSPDSGYVLGGQTSTRQHNRDHPSSWIDYGPQYQDHVVQTHGQTGFQRVVSYMPYNHLACQPPYPSHPGPVYSQGPYSEDWVKDNIYHCRHRLSQTLEDLRHVRRVYSRARLEHYRRYDEVYYYGDVRTRLQGSEGRYGDERRHEIHFPWDDLNNVTR